MASHLIVRHGAMRFLGEFDPGGDTYVRGEEVVLRTDRGMEIGQVLCAASPQALALLSEPTAGRILRRLTDKDRADRAQFRQREREELETCSRFAQQRHLQMELVDAEHLLGGERIVFYFLAEKRVDFRELV